MRDLPEKLEEWCFLFMLYNKSTKPVAYEAANALLDSMTEWADRHNWGIGGGFRSPAGDKWHFNFGLCLTETDEPIPRGKAEELMQLAVRWAQERGFSIRGGFRPFDERDEAAFEENMKRWESDE